MSWRTFTASTTDQLSFTSVPTDLPAVGCGLMAQRLIPRSGTQINRVPQRWITYGLLWETSRVDLTSAVPRITTTYASELLRHLYERESYERFAEYIETSFWRCCYAYAVCFVSTNTCNSGFSQNKTTHCGIASASRIYLIPKLGQVGWLN